MTDFQTQLLCNSPGVEMNSVMAQKKIWKWYAGVFVCLHNFKLCKTTRLKKTGLASFKQQQAMAHLLTVLQVIKKKKISTSDVAENKEAQTVFCKISVPALSLVKRKG